TRTDTDLSAAIQNALQALLPQIREEIYEEFRTGSGSSNAGVNPPPVTIYTHLGECRRAAGTCFKCGQAGHLQKDCKKNTTTSTSV
nr:hypothetical protein [Tanacetum cinerariifolium]